MYCIPITPLIYFVLEMAKIKRIDLAVLLNEF